MYSSPQNDATFEGFSASFVQIKFRVLNLSRTKHQIEEATNQFELFWVAQT